MIFLGFVEYPNIPTNARGSIVGDAKCKESVRIKLVCLVPRHADGRMPGAAARIP